MSTISSISSLTGSAATGTTSTETRLPAKTLGQDDFLKILATQFQAQDPLKPADDTSFIAQMAQFSALSQSSAMAKEMTQMRAAQQRATANSYLGHRVTVDAGNSKVVTGDVAAIDDSGSEPKLVVSGNPYALSAVLRVEPGSVSNPASLGTN